MFCGPFGVMSHYISTKLCENQLTMFKSENGGHTDCLAMV